MPHVINRKADFSKVRGLLAPNECTPEPDGDFEGILINAPEEVLFEGAGELAAGTVIPLCGRCKLPYDYLGLDGAFVPAMLFVAVNAATHRAHAGRLEPTPNRLPPPGPRVPQPGLRVGKYFNPNLAAIMTLPAEEADYLVYATLGAYQSNVLRVRLRRPGEGAPWKS
jgi:hypothetical protein